MFMAGFAGVAAAKELNVSNEPIEVKNATKLVMWDHPTVNFS
ncbi:hypothetical protein [Mycoplasma wenyonii]|nr:hypothetical protein [Mycoplasma wenyonii]